MIRLQEINKKIWIGYGLVFLLVYSMIDGLNMSYGDMAREHGTWLVVTNIALNVLMGAIAGFMIALSDYVLKFKGIKTKGDSMSFLSVLFGIFTYGCTPCVISFLAVFGINFSVLALPFAGLPYKLISLALMGLGIWILSRELKRNQCDIRL